MTLPTGFNIETGTLGRIENTVRSFSPQTTRRTSTYSSSGFGDFWERLNDGISRIGEWLQEDGAHWISLVAAGLPALGGIICLLIWVVSVFADDGIFWGILSIFGALFVVGIGYYAVCLIFGIVFFLVRLIGYVFYNAYTLLAAILVISLVTVIPLVTDSNKKDKNSDRTEVTAPAYTVKYCTVNVLNVRSGPSKTSRVIGTIRKGDSVKVYTTQNGFSKISWNDSYGYVSSTYLSDTQR